MCDKFLRKSLQFYDGQFVVHLGASFPLGTCSSSEFLSRLDTSPSARIVWKCAHDNFDIRLGLIFQDPAFFVLGMRV